MARCVLGSVSPRISPLKLGWLVTEPNQHKATRSKRSPITASPAGRHKVDCHYEVRNCHGVVVSEATALGLKRRWANLARIWAKTSTCASYFYSLGERRRRAVRMQSPRIQSFRAKTQIYCQILNCSKKISESADNKMSRKHRFIRIAQYFRLPAIFAGENS
jgi:hypothetical protein